MANEITTDNINTKAQEVASIGDGDYVYIFKTGAQGFSRIAASHFAQGGSSGSGNVTVEYDSLSKTTTITVGGASSTPDVEPDPGSDVTTKPTISVQNMAGGKKVMIASQSGATAYYTIDGSTPTTSSTTYSSAIEFTTLGTYTVKAIAKASGKEASEVATNTFSVTRCDSPTITSATANGQTVITATKSGATVYISTDGDHWTSGNGSASVTIAQTSAAQNVTVYAYAKQSGYVDSEQTTQNVTVPASGSSVSSNIFSGMSTSPVEAITINGTTYTDIENTAVNGGYEWSIDFGDTEFGTITYDGTSTTSIFTDGETDQRANITGISQMPDSWTTIGAYALYCANCTSANIGTKVTSILANAFYNTGITDIVVPDTVNSIAANSFRSAKPHTIYVGSHSIGGVAFIPTADNASKLTSITFGPSVSQIGNSPFGSRAFTNLATATFLGSTPPTVTSDANLFGTSQADGFKIIVPKGSKSAYESVLTSWTSVIEEAE